jgi:hypothetical protein
LKVHPGESQISTHLGVESSGLLSRNFHTRKSFNKRAKLPNF